VEAGPQPDGAAGAIRRDDRDRQQHRPTLDLTPRGNAQLFFDVEDQPTSPCGQGRPLLAHPSSFLRRNARIDVNLLDAYRIVKGQTLHAAAGAGIRRACGSSANAWRWKSSRPRTRGARLRRAAAGDARKVSRA
jgi:hypothetical protein